MMREFLMVTFACVVWGAVGAVLGYHFTDARGFIACYPDGSGYADNFLGENVTKEEFTEALDRVCWNKLKWKPI